MKRIIFLLLAFCVGTVSAQVSSRSAGFVIVTGSFTASAPLVVSGSPSTTFSMTKADTSTDGYLATGDWNKFDLKQSTGASGATLTNLTAANISAGSLGASVICSSVAVGKVENSALAGSISPAKITGTAAILGANSFTAAQSVVGGVVASTSATSGSSLTLGGSVVTLSTMPVRAGIIYTQTSDQTVYMSTRAYTENVPDCLATGCYVKLSN